MRFKRFKREKALTFLRADLPSSPLMSFFKRKFVAFSAEKKTTLLCGNYLTFSLGRKLSFKQMRALCMRDRWLFFVPHLPGKSLCCPLPLSFSSWVGGFLRGLGS